MPYKLDSNHQEIIEAFQKLGCKVVDNAKVKRQESGQLDLWVGMPNVYSGLGIWIWVEVKTESGQLRSSQSTNIQEALDKGLPVEVVKNIADVEAVHQNYLAIMQGLAINRCFGCNKVIPNEASGCDDCIPF